MTGKTTKNGRQTDYAGYLDGRLKAGRWQPFFVEFAKVMTRDEALTLAVIFNASRLGSTDGWVMVTPRFLMNNLGLKNYEEQQIIRSLEANRIIDVSKRGTPALRHIRVDVKRIEEMLIDHDEGARNYFREGAR
jgi:hypothetical protein